MPKETGLGDKLYVNGYDLSGTVGAIQTIGVTLGEQDVTGLDKSAVERLQLLGDGELTFSSYFTGGATSDSSAVNAHQRLKTLSTTAVATYLRGTTQGGGAAGLVCKQFQYQLDRGQNGSLLGSVNCKASGGNPVEWGFILDAAAAPTAVGNQTTGLDLGASHGYTSMSFYLHVTAFTGTSVVLIVQTDDNSGFSSPTTYATFATVSGRTYERVRVASAPERYIRWRANSGTFSAVSFVVTASPNTTA